MEKWLEENKEKINALTEYYLETTGILLNNESIIAAIEDIFIECRVYPVLESSWDKRLIFDIAVVMEDPDLSVSMPASIQFRKQKLIRRESIKLRGVENETK